MYVPVSEVVTYTLFPTQPQRREELTICNVLFCLLVMWIHILSEAVDGYDRSSVLYFLAVGLWRLSSFVVQGFFFLAGTKLFLHGGKQSTLTFTKKRLWRVVLPYVVVFCLFAVYLTLTGAVSLTPGTFVRQLFTGKLCGHFYYVILMVQFDLLRPLWKRIVQKTEPILGCITALLLMILCKIYLPGVITMLTGEPFEDNGLLFTSYLFYYVAGVYCGRSYDRFRGALDRYRTSIVTTWCLLGVLNWVFMWTSSTGRYFAPWLEVFHILYCLYAILGCLSLAYLWREKPLFRKKWFRCWDRYSYQIYLLHPLLLFFCGDLCGVLGITSISLRLGIRCAAVAAALCILGKLPGKLPSKLPTLPKRTK